MATEIGVWKMHVFFIVDRVLGMEATRGVVETQLRDLVAGLERDSRAHSRCQYYLVLTGAPPAHMDRLAAPSELRLPPMSCDLGVALRLVTNELERLDGKPPVELVVLLGSQPDGDWHKPVQQLKTSHRAKITVCDLSDKWVVANQDLKAIQTSDRQALHSNMTMLGAAFATEVLPSLRDSALRVAMPAETRLEEAPRPGKAAIAQPYARLVPPTEVPAHPPAGDGPPNPSADRGRATPQPDSASPDVPEIDLNPNKPGNQSGGNEAPPPVDKDGVATLWKEIEPADDLGDRVPHSLKAARAGAPGWLMVAASRRGKMHAHKGIFREDAFAMDEVDGWHLVVVADGGGSCPLSRVGSKLAADTGVATMRQWVEQLVGSGLSTETICEEALREGVQAAWDRLFDEARQRNRELRDFGTTYLALMHRETAEGHVIGVLQIGDGVIAAEMADGAIELLAQGDVGEVASVTVFLTSKPKTEWIVRAAVRTLSSSPRLLAAMCDGVADDFIPFEQYLGRLFANLHQVTDQKQPEQVLLDILGYDKRGSFDDRTLAMIVRSTSPSGGIALPPVIAEAVVAEPGAAIDAAQQKATAGSLTPAASLPTEITAQVQSEMAGATSPQVVAADDEGQTQSPPESDDAARSAIS